MGSYGFSLKHSHTFCVLALQRGSEAVRCLYRLESATVGNEFADCLTHTLEIISMSRGKQAQGSKGGSDSQWTTFVDIPLVGVTAKEIDDRYGSWDDFDSDLASLLASGYRVGVSYNTGNTAFIVSVTCRDDSSVNAGCTFTAFAGDWYTALRVALFKHYVVAQENWRGAGSERTNAHFG